LGPYYINSFMMHGASGSMLIDSELNILGIYWGMFNSGITSYPSVSVFNSSIKNFIAPYDI
jgi:hypothetical protein